MNKLIITTDLSKDRNRIIETGLEFARKLRAEVDLLTIINTNLDYIPADIGINFSDQWEARKYIAEQTLEAVKQQYPDLPLNVVVLIGDPKEDIINYAIEQKAAVIVMGTVGRTGLSHAVMGSTAEYIIRHSPIPVLVVPLQNELH
ncbi:MAG: universal stress protein [Sediminibacterium sp.]|nr:universal stress protein [Sediminibacterium sp.]